MPVPVGPIIAGLAPIAGSLIGKAIGGSKPKNTAAVPQDLAGTRGNQINLLNYLLGFGGPPPGMGQPPGPQGYGNLGNAVGQFQQRRAGQGPGGAIQQNPFGQQGLNFGGPGTPGPNIGPGQQDMASIPQPPGGGMRSGPGMANAGFGQAPMTGGQTPQGGNGGMLQDRLQSYFGNLGMQQSGLQNQAAQGMSQFLNQQSPEMRTLNQAYPFLQDLQGSTPGTGLDPNATARLGQGMTQSGLPGQAGGFYNQLLQGQPNLGPGQDVEGMLGQFAQTGGFGGQSGQGLEQNLMSLLQSGGGGAGDLSALQGLAASNPGQGVVDALRPRFDQNLAAANQQGGRFGSANAVLRSRALDDFNLMGANALQQGASQQIQAATALGQLLNQQGANSLQARLGAGSQLASLLGQQAGNRLGATNALGGFRQQGAISGMQGQLQGAGALGQFGMQDLASQLGAAGMLNQQGMQGQQNFLQGQGQQLQGIGLQGQLAGQAGMNDWQRLLGGFGAGQQMTQNSDIETQRRLNLIQSLMGGAQSAAFNVPMNTTPSGAQQGANIGGGIGQLIAALGPILSKGASGIVSGGNVPLGGMG